MDPWDTVDPLSLPLGASRNDRVVGMTEWGLPVYKTATGQEYFIDPQAVQGGSRVKPMLNALADDPYGAAKGVVNALAQGAWNAISAPGRAAAGEPVTYGDALDTMGMVSLGAMPFAKPQGALGANSFKAYHGSPHDFDRFSMDKIGTGEGAQAYGHGLYFAEAEDVAKSYRDALSAPTSPVSVVARAADGAEIPWYQLSKDEQTLLGHLSDSGGDYEKAFATLPDVFVPQAVGRKRAVLQSLQERGIVPGRPGHMYEVQINADPDTFLDWDAPLSEQPANVQDVLRSFGAKPDDVGAAAYSRAGVRSFPVLGPDGRWGPGGATFEESLAIAGGDAARVRRTLDPSAPNRSEGLRQAGIPGIKYKDAGSRGADGSGTRNFVVFDDSLIEILRKYGLVPGMFGAGLYAAQPPSSNEELRNYLGAL